jgi:RNA polymerase sigma-70 factor (ECF subfamily)
VDQDQLLADAFEAHRTHLQAVARRLLGSTGEADDAVQEAWIRLSRSDAATIDNLGGWLTTVVSRVSLDMLRARASRREDPTGGHPPDGAPAGAADPEHDSMMADAVGAALLVVLDTLRPAERLAFVLHDTFGVPFDEIGVVLNRSPNAAKQLASRARAKVAGTGAGADADPARRRRIVDAFLAASRHGNFEALLALLDPDIVLEADAGAVAMGAAAEVQGASAVAAVFSGRALGAEPASIDGAMGLVWMVADTPRVAWQFTTVDDRIVHIEMVATPETLDQIDLVVLDR